MAKGSWFSYKKPTPKYESNEQLFVGLQKLETAAIVLLQTKALATVQQLVKGYGLSSVEAEDILNRSTVIFLQKIEDGSYLFQGHAPSTYLIEIAKRLALMATRTQKKSAEPLDNYEHLHDETWETEQKQREAAEMTRQLLTQLGEPCQQVVRLHHIDGYSDEEVIQGKMTRYTTADSLKMKRSDCMKKLIQLGAQWRTLINT
ncbi:MAG: hypothetical protein RIR11_1729 [Bacteroidota bacterium]|jgi:DNA-directed RNA polymerase specialized sigma24 family protein